MYRSRKMISVYIEDRYTHWSLSWFGTCTSIKRGKINTHTDHFPGLVHVLQWKGQDRYIHWSLSWLGTWSDQCVYRSCPFHWSICTKPGKWSVCASILPFLFSIKKGKINTHTDHFPGLQLFCSDVNSQIYVKNCMSGKKFNSLMIIWPKKKKQPIKIGWKVKILYKPSKYMQNVKH
jgi:hypothetical protein